MQKLAEKIARDDVWAKWVEANSQLSAKEGCISRKEGCISQAG
ncbi:hypothetical protein [Amycolatopsis sp. MtRt-6]|nr:hypothetical protein [Amycolatopsis sp. MtRt-6]